MSGWSRTVKPSADTTVPAGEIFGVDAAEASANVAIASPGWVRKLTYGGRTRYETLVAMKTGPVEDNADDTAFPDGKITIRTQPQSVTVEAPDPVTLRVEVEVAPPSLAITYLWQVSTDGGSNWNAVSGATTATLQIADSTGLNGRRYRCIIAGPANSGIVNVATDSVLLTVE